jgi:hypothetical protein
VALDGSRFRKVERLRATDVARRVNVGAKGMYAFDLTIATARKAAPLAVYGILAPLTRADPIVQA